MCKIKHINQSALNLYKREREHREKDQGEIYFIWKITKSPDVSSKSSKRKTKITRQSFTGKKAIDLGFPSAKTYETSSFIELAILMHSLPLFFKHAMSSAIAFFMFWKPSCKPRLNPFLSIVLAHVYPFLNINMVLALFQLDIGQCMYPFIAKLSSLIFKNCILAF